MPPGVRKIPEGEQFNRRADGIRRVVVAPSVIAPGFLPDRIVEETQKPGGPAIVYGVVLILLMFLIPNGVGGLFRKVEQLLTRRRYSRAAK